MDETSRAIVELLQDPGRLLPELFEREGDYPRSIELYFRHYGLDLPTVAHRFGTFESGPYKLAAHIFRPLRPRGTVLALHGYLDHSGILAPLVQPLSQAGYAVALLDLPGHGLSSGERAAIANFADYVTSLETFLALCGERLPSPYHLVGHSTGAAAILDHLLHSQRRPPGRVVLIAPLVRSYAWRLSVLGRRLAGLVTGHVPRVLNPNSSDPEFLRFVKRDPLQPWRIPLSWARALEVWLAQIADAPRSEERILILQGTSDKTVDQKYNLPFLRQKFPAAEVIVYEGGRHHLIREAEPLQRRVLETVLRHLDRSSTRRNLANDSEPRFITTVPMQPTER